MRTNTLKRQALIGSSALVAVALLASQPAFAQQTAAADAAADEEGTIVVTGSLIKNPNLQLSSPVNVVSEQTIQARQIQNAEELLRDLPGVVPAIGSAVNNGNGGASTINLRGLGSQRNLALIDGDRIVPFGSGGIFDLNNVPLALISRVDVLTGGASTTYGADAVSGVVNFVTKQNFTGFDARVSYGLTERGDGNRFRADVTMGGDFADGKGNAVISLGYQKTDPVYQGDRDFSLFQISSANGRAAGGSPTDTPTSFDFTGEQDFLLQNTPNGDGFVPANVDGFNFAPFNIFQTPFERFNIFAQAKYEIADGIEVYGRGMFSKNSVKTIIAPSGVFGESLTTNINNPFISAGQRATICAAIPTLDCSVGSTATFVIPAVYRRTVEVGPRTSNFVTTLFDYKVGVRGDITSSIRFDVSASYGQSNQVQNLDGYTLKSRVSQALLADNTTACRTIAGGCVPLNLFGGPGSITPAMANYIRGQSTVAVDTGLGQVRGVINGDVGLTIPSAANPISFAVGAEYRNYTYRRTPDNLSQVPGELGGGGGAVLPFTGGYDVYEGFAEVNVPLVEDKPFFKSLALEGGIRQSHYSINAPGNPSFDTTTWKLGASWAPSNDIKFRGGYNRAARSPNIGELFAPVATGLTSLAVDPCSGTKAQGNANLTAVCIAQGATANQIAAGSIQDPAAGQANATGGGNPNLRPEIADTWTIGGVLTPSFLPGFALTVDYFNVKVNTAIAAATPGDIISACFDNITATSATNPACTEIRRNPVNGRLSGPTGTTFGLPQPLTNRGRFETSGIDLSANYATDVGFAKLNLNFNGTYTLRNRFRASATALNRECIGQYSVNCGVSNGAIQPKWTHNARAGLDFGPANVFLLWRYIGNMRYEDNRNPATGALLLAPRFNGVITGSGPLVGRTYNFNRISAYSYFDMGAGFKIMDNVSLDLLVANLFDKKPPIVGSTLGTTGQNSGNTYPSTYDALGRRYNVTLGVKF
ncbi:TonB-dependent receptor domain-containing protein [Sandarakinorhabdus oryzae]|uniref:TonB-dependent receptor domain-containing protein n=1 Tax=Sandarakinorhabdus oryzae TaxID=2675220 RepID=UPI0012E2484D|nr:TonB-dependent receptor [Sandarakinorhabdus oryzae]